MLELNPRRVELSRQHTIWSKHKPATRPLFTVAVMAGKAQSG